MGNNRNFATTQSLMGALLFICALVFYYFSVLRIDYRNTNLLDLGTSDPTHYFAQAKALLRYGWPSIQIGYDRMPSLWPAGYPALMLPGLRSFRKQIPSLRRSGQIKRSACCCSSAYSAFI